MYAALFMFAVKILWDRGMERTEKSMRKEKEPRGERE